MPAVIRQRVRLWIPLLLLLCLRSAALEVEETRWGFDGKVVPRTFAVLSVLVSNPRPEPFEGMIQLERNAHGSFRAGAPLVRAIAVAPFSSRWVQFYPRISTNNRAWKLRWGRGGSYDVKNPTLGAPGSVCLTSERTIASRQAGLRPFPDTLFPPLVEATRGLHAVTLGHAPRWGPARRRAFMNWLRLGGTVHVCTTETGRFPLFGKEMTSLNHQEASQTRICDGRIVWHQETPAKITQQILDETGFPCSKLVNTKSYVGSLDSSLLRNLGQVVRPKHNWILFLCVSALYIGIVGPGCFFLGFRKRNCARPILLLLVSAVLFSILFLLIGRRGYGEESTVTSINYARALEPGQYAVTQWTSAFVTDGDTYKLSYDVPAGLFSTAHANAAVKGMTQNGVGAAFLIDMPLFSSCSYVHKAVMPGPILSPIKVTMGHDKVGLTKLNITFDRVCLTGMRRAWCVQGDRVLDLHQQRLQTLASSRNSAPFDTFYSKGTVQAGFSYNHRYGRYNTEEPPEQHLAKVADSAAPALSAFCALGGTDAVRQCIKPRRSEPDRVDVFLLMDSAKFFRVTEPRFKKHLGFTLYHLVVYRTEPESEGP
ncbi:MAG: hypothetical protein KAI66_06880 [Lentisphaeria bacterium]|nr:hypothetical protein [Lentisphaeria bacterium]